jgi:hypothetical protein
MSFLDPLLGAIAYDAEVTQLGAIGYGAEVPATLAQPGRCGANVAPSSTPQILAPSSLFLYRPCMHCMETKTQTDHRRHCLGAKKISHACSSDTHGLFTSQIHIILLAG